MIAVGRVKELRGASPLVNPKSEGRHQNVQPGNFPPSPNSAPSMPNLSQLNPRHPTPYPSPPSASVFPNAARQRALLLKPGNPLEKPFHRHPIHLFRLSRSSHRGHQVRKKASNSKNSESDFRNRLKVETTSAIPPLFYLKKGNRFLVKLDNKGSDRTKRSPGGDSASAAALADHFFYDILCASAISCQFFSFGIRGMRLIQLML